MGEQNGEKEESPALRLLRLVWRNEGHGWGHSWARLNAVMYDTLTLAIVGGLRFDPDDFIAIFKELGFNWWGGEEGIERYYRLACNSRSHGGRDYVKPNMSACQAIEKTLDRKPFLYRERGCAGSQRLAVGLQFRWEDQWFKITSFNTVDTMVACAYKYEPYDESKRFMLGDKYFGVKSFNKKTGALSVVEIKKPRVIVDKRIIITRDQLREHNKAVMAELKSQKEAVRQKRVEEETGEKEK